MRIRPFAIASLLAGALLWAAPAMGQTPSAEALAAARELLVASKTAEQYKAIMPMLVQTLKPMIVQGRPQVERDFDAIMPTLLSGFQSRFDEISESIAKLYASSFTAAELREVTGFYRGPTGQKLLEKLPHIMQQSMAIGQQIGQRMGEELKARIIEELRKKGHNI
jgi:hypothetical protein